MCETEATIYVEITGTRGSTPRDAGTAMCVTLTETTGTIGGGALEFNAIKTARNIIASGSPGTSETIPLGPSLGQCCGGSVTLRYSFQVPPPAEYYPSPRPTVLSEHPVPLWLWGAGHVGRAVVAHSPQQAFNLTWIDTTPERFSASIPAHVTAIPAANMPLLASRAPVNAHHLIFTYSHEIDLALCAALIKRSAASIGLIGSETKWARFSKRLRDMKLDPNHVTCPIGDKALGKHPDQIAHGTVRALLCASQAKVSS